MQKKSLILALNIIGLLLVGCESKQEEHIENPPSVPVTVVSPVVKDITVYLETIGILNPSIFMEVLPRTSGTLTDVFIKEGQWVHEGSPLFTIDPKLNTMKVQEAEAQLAMNQALLNGIQKKINRLKALVQKDLVSQIEWEDLLAQFEHAKATIDLDEARLNAAKLDLDFCMINSPIEGRIGKLDAHSGLLVKPDANQPLATISKMDPLTVEFSITEKEFPKIHEKIGQIEVTSLCSNRQIQNGEITFLDNHFDSKTGLLLIRGKVDNPNALLRPGQSVKVRVPVESITNVKLIPQRAVMYNQHGPYVYVVQNDMSVAIRQVILGSEYGTDQIVLEGIDVSEPIILNGHLRLFPGITVEIKP